MRDKVVLTLTAHAFTQSTRALRSASGVGYAALLRGRIGLHKWLGVINSRLMQHFLNLTQADLEKPIYRIVSFERLVEMFTSRKLVLAHPTKWDDPFETHVIGAKFRIGNATTERAHRRVIHGQCWTRKSQSDALWRIYSPNKDAVRIRTTPTLLGEALAQSLQRLPRSKWFLGKVAYLPQKDLVGRASELAAAMLKDTSETAAAQSLLFKRNSFSHESEIRALVVDRHGRAKSGLLQLAVDPHAFIQSIYIDSRAPSSIVEVYSRHLENEIKFRGKVERSTLYDPPAELIVDIPQR